MRLQYKAPPGESRVGLFLFLEQRGESGSPNFCVLIVPTLRVVTPFRTLRVLRVTQSVTRCIPTRSVGNDHFCGRELAREGYGSVDPGMTGQPGLIASKLPPTTHGNCC